MDISKVLEKIRELLYGVKDSHISYDISISTSKEEEDIIIDKLYELYEYLQRQEKLRFQKGAQNN